MLTDASAAIAALETDLGTVNVALLGCAVVILAGRWIIARFF